MSSVARRRSRWELHIPRSPGCFRARLGSGAKLPPPRQATDTAGVGLERRQTRTRTPSVRLTLNLAIEPGTTAITDPFTRSHPAPFQATRTYSPLPEGKEPPQRPTPYPLGLPRGSPRRYAKDASHRLLQPIHSTRAPVNRPTPEPRSVRCGDRLRSVLRGVSPRARRSTAPDRLAAIQPQVEERLTATLQLRSPGAHPSVVRRRRAPPEGGAAPSRRFQPQKGPAVRPLTLPVAPRPRSDDARRAREEPGPLPLPPRQRRAAFSGPKRLPSTSAPERPLARTGTRHRSRGFAAVEPASGALSPLSMLSHEGTRPSAITQAHRPWSRGPHAARRILQS